MLNVLLPDSVLPAQFRSSETICPSRKCDRTLGPRGDVGFVRHHDDRAALVVQPFEQIQEFRWSSPSRDCRSVRRPE